MVIGLVGGGVGLSPGSAMAAAIPYASPSSKSTAGPNTRACYPGWEFDITAQPENMQFVNMEQGSIVYNNTQSPLTRTSSITRSVSKSSSTSASLQAGWGPINASVGYSADRTQSYTQSDSIQITVNPGYMGWIDYGVSQNEWEGYYEYLQSNCTYTDSTFMTVYSPKVPAQDAITQRQS